MSCCSLRVYLCVRYNLLLSRDLKYRYKTSFLELNLTVEVSAREQALLSGVFLWVDLLGLFFLKERVAREGEAILGLADFNCWNKTSSLHKCPFFCCNIFCLHTKSGTGWVDLEVGSGTQSASVVSATQGDYDPSRTKVLHFSMNPASLAKQQRKEEQQQLQEECERLRELVRVLEGGGSIPGNLEGVGSFQSPQEIAGRLLASGHEDALTHPYCQRN